MIKTKGVTFGLGEDLEVQAHWSLDNDQRKKAISKFPRPKVAVTMWITVKQLVPASSKMAARIQIFALDAMAPLTSLLEAESREELLTTERVMGATTNAVELIGKANARISCLRREMCASLNKASTHQS